MSTTRFHRLILALAALTLLAPAASAVDAARRDKAHDMIDRAIVWLRANQDQKTGGWGLRPQGPQFPAITALVVNGMLMSPDIDEYDPAVSRGLDFILSHRKPDGGIYDQILPSYNTSISLSTLARVHRPDAAAAIKPAQDFLRSIQWSENTVVSADSPSAPANATSVKIDRTHPYYGGVGYGGSGRPDLSNLHFMLQGLHDSGLSSEDVAFQRALVFLQRVQMHDAVNDMPYAEGSKQGGFVYATGPNKDAVGQGESKGATIEETLDDGTTVSRLRAYGSMTYAGFKSYIYANLPRDDQRVQLALDWIRRHYSLEENPGVGMQGYYYFLVTFSRALDAWGEDTLDVVTRSGATEQRDWANDLIDRLAELQKEDGSFENLHDRWMEGDPALVTAYALLALQHAVN